MMCMGLNPAQWVRKSLEPKDESQDQLWRDERVLQAEKGPCKGPEAKGMGVLHSCLETEDQNRLSLMGRVCEISD